MKKLLCLTVMMLAVSTAYGITYGVLENPASGLFSDQITIAGPLGRKPSGDTATNPDFKLSDIKQDPTTGKLYYIDSKTGNRVDVRMY